MLQPEIENSHERFGVDLDKFERQMVSYGLSRDPTVLLTLGARMIREMRGHLEAEEQLCSGLKWHTGRGKERT